MGWLIWYIETPITQRLTASFRKNESVLPYTNVYCSHLGDKVRPTITFSCWLPAIHIKTAGLGACNHWYMGRFGAHDYRRNWSHWLFASISGTNYLFIHPCVLLVWLLYVFSAHIHHISTADILTQWIYVYPVHLFTQCIYVYPVHLFTYCIYVYPVHLFTHCIYVYPVHLFTFVTYCL